MRTREEWDRFYQVANPWGTVDIPEDRVRQELLIEHLRHARFECAIDIGCGEGHQTNELSRLANRMVGYDISGTALERARQTYPHLQFEQGDILDMLKDPSVKSQPFDFVCAAEVLYYLQAEADRREAIAGLARLGTPNCLYFFSVIVVPGSAQRRYFTYQEFVDLLSGHFCIIDSFACWPRETPAFRALRRLAPTRAARHRFVRTWTKLCRPEAAKHAGYFALKRLVH